MIKKKCRSIAIFFLLTVSFNAGASEFTKDVNSDELRGKLLYLKNGNIWYLDIKTRKQKKITKSGKITNYTVSPCVSIPFASVET